MVSAMGVGFPLACFFVEPGTGGTFRSRKVSVTEFKNSICADLPEFKPHFFTNKDKP